MGLDSTLSGTPARARAVWLPHPQRRLMSLRFAALLIIGLVAACAAPPSSTGAGPKPTSSFDWSRRDIVVADSTVARVPLTKSVPRYPMRERMHGVEAAFVTVFVLDTLGRVEIGSVSFFEDPPRAFAESVCDYFRNSRYAPLRVEGASTPALVVVPWVFALEGGKWLNRSLDVSGLRERLRREGAVAALAEFRGLAHCPAR